MATAEPPSTPSSLIAGLRANAADAWHRLAHLYAPTVWSWCRQRGLQPADADDVLQEVFRTVVVRVAEFRRERAGDTFRGWLWTITRYKLGDHFRREDRADEAAGEMLDSLPAPATPPAGNEALFRRALDLINRHAKGPTWQAFWAVVVEDRRPEDVAAELGMSVNAVYLAKARLLRRLRDELGETE
jgi:RNA polymerase sigma-70 factor (ECF subfamily)